MSDNTSAKVEEIRERLAVIGATRPWHSIKDNDGEIGAYDDCGEPLPRGPEDVDFIAHAPEDIEWLMGEVDRLQETISTRYGWEGRPEVGDHDPQRCHPKSGDLTYHLDCHDFIAFTATQEDALALQEVYDDREALRTFAVRVAVAVASEGCEDLAASLSPADLPALAEVVESMASPSPVSEGVELEATRLALAEARAEVERLTADLAQTRAAAREQIAEKDALLSEMHTLNTRRIGLADMAILKARVLLAPGDDGAQRILEAMSERHPNIDPDDAVITGMVREVIAERDSLRAERDRIIGEVMREMEAIRDMCAEPGTLPTREEAAAELRAAGLEPGKVGRELRLRLEAASVPAPRPDYADLFAELGEVRVRFGLDAQGHVPTIERMLAEGASWEDIGAAIHWDPATVRRHWAARQAALAVTAGLSEDEVMVVASCGPHLHETGGIPFEEGDGLAEGWCAGCEKDLRPDGPIRQSKSYDSPYQEWACPHCGHVEDDPDLSLSDLRDVMVEGWEMPKAPEEGSRPVAKRHCGDWLLTWDHPALGDIQIFQYPFRPGVTVTPDMLRALGFTVEE